MRRRLPRSLALALALAGAAAPRTARAVLDTPGFRAVAVAQTAYPISAIAVAPDGRLFATVQELGQTSGSTPGTAEIRVFSAYKSTDGATLDTGSLWATVDGVRATTIEEGLLGIALAPDFATSKLVYVYLTTTDESVNQHIRVYRENDQGTGDLLGVVQSTLEPPTESTTRDGGHMAFGVDGCLLAGVGDNGSGNRWNAQLFSGTDPMQGAENTALCTNVCLGTTEYPARTVTNNGAANFAGKVLRFAVEGASTAQPAPGNPFTGQPFVFGAGLRNPAGLAVHPLTGQVYVADRSDTLQAEIDLVTPGSNQGWPCLEGAGVSSTGAAACLSGHTASEVYANHPSWSHAIVAHTGNPVVSGVAAYTGLAYPEEFYGDVFYLLRDSARIYRLDLAPPCFMPTASELAPLVFHDSNNDNDFRAIYDIDGDMDFDNIGLSVLTAIAQGPSPIGADALYIAGKQGGGFTDDSVVYRIEFATSFTPYSGPTGRVPDSCFAGGENPFTRATCLAAGGPCPGQPDGTACDDGDPCNGTETCQAGVCQHGPAATDGTSCAAADACHAAGTCQSGQCVAGATLADGTPCPDGDPCNGTETCQAGSCQAATGPAALGVGAISVRGSALVLRGELFPPAPMAPSTTDDLTLTVEAGGSVLFSSTLTHPESDPLWAKSKPPSLFKYKDGAGSVGGLRQLQVKQHGPGFAFRAKGRSDQLLTLQGGAVATKLVIGGQCYTATVPCVKKGRGLRCAQ
ncbi:MAG: PQQ-dependent sugar dehydrogenase [Candidatus Binatia bacterium]